MIKTLITLISFVLVFIHAYAQPFVEQTTINMPGLNFCSSQWGDFDNDGDLDLLLNGVDGQGAQKIGIYKNDNSSFVQKIGSDFTNVTSGLVSLGDVNNDGWLDILVPEFYSSSFSSSIYTNNGNNTFTAYVVDLPRSDILGSCSFIDFDTDGDLDLSFSISKEISFYENIKTGFIRLPSLINDGEDFISAWGDYNNDGYIDMVTTNADPTATKLFSNNSDFTLNEQSTNMTGVRRGGISWGDYDSDGDLDLLLTGGYGDWSYRTHLFKNNGSSGFSRVNTSFKGLEFGTVAWGDYDNDGDLDILYCGAGGGHFTKVYRNNGNDSFSEQTDLNLPGVAGGVVSWVDYDNDGDLDLFLTGSGKTKLYRNDCPTTNTAPTAPTVLSASTSDSITTFTWEAPTDDFTPSAALTYNLRVGTTPGGCEIVSPMADTSGYRRIVGMGNAQLGTSYLLKNLKPGTYYWSVQAIDNGYAGGAFAEEQSFTISGVNGIENNSADAINIFPNPCQNKITINCPNFIEANIYSTSGTLMITSDNYIIDIQNLQRGVYVVKAKSGQGYLTAKFLK